jgi:hypothetical protein
MVSIRLLLSQFMKGDDNGRKKAKKSEEDDEEKDDEEEKTPQVTHVFSSTRKKVIGFQSPFFFCRFFLLFKYRGRWRCASCSS